MYRYIAALLIISASNSLAENGCKVSNLESLLVYLESRGPALSETIAKKKQIDSEVDLASQRPNPQVSFEYLKGDQFGVEISNYSLTAEHTIELGNKRSKRISRSESFRNLNDFGLNISLYQANSNSMVQYQRAAQLAILIRSVREAIRTFDKVTQKLSSRSRLTPEETVSLSTLKLASNDYKAQLNEFENQLNLLQGELEFLTDCESLKVDHYRLNFPASSTILKSSERGGLRKLEDLKVKLANSEYEIQKSLGYSNLQVGPALLYQSLGNEESVSLGISMSFDFPLFQTNDGGKLKALNTLHSQKLQSSNRKSMFEIRKRNLMSKYRRSLSLLKSMPSLKKLEKKHFQVERLFARGIVSIPMTIESHRQQVDFLKSRFETEIDLMETYAELLLLNGDLKGLYGLVK